MRRLRSRVVLPTAVGRPSNSARPMLRSRSLELLRPPLRVPCPNPFRRERPDRNRRARSRPGRNRRDQNPPDQNRQVRSHPGQNRRDRNRPSPKSPKPMSSDRAPPTPVLTTFRLLPTCRRSMLAQSLNPEKGPSVTVAGLRKGLGPRLKLMSCEYVPASATPFAFQSTGPTAVVPSIAEHRDARVDFTLSQARTITMSGDRVALTGAETRG